MTVAPAVRPAPAASALARASRISAILTAVGAVAVLTGLVLSANALADAHARLAQVEQRQLAAQTELTATAAKLKATTTNLAQSRCALANSRSAIEAFHQRNYQVAITMYDEALRCDPENAYILNLNAYSHFKKGDVAGSIMLEQRSVHADPNYGWGYFDLARFYCARDGGRGSEAQAAIDKAIQLDGRMASLMATDGEFSKLCRAGAG